MFLTDSFIEYIPLLKKIILDCGLHAVDGAVPIDLAIERYKIKLKMEALPVRALYGISIADIRKPDNRSMVINTRSAFEYQRKTKAHELYHLLAHAKGCPYYSWVGEKPYNDIEKEADCGAAYLLVPIGHVLECATYGWTVEQIAFDLMVPPALVDLRYKIAVALDELRGWDS